VRRLKLTTDSCCARASIEKFPRSHKFTIGDRIEALSLNVLESLIEATYTRERTQHLRMANLGIEKLRFLLRPAADLTMLDRRRYEHAARTLDSGEPHPTYRCLYPEPPPEGAVPACAEAGVLGARTGMLGAMMALEVIREIVGFGEGLVGRLLLVDAINMRFETVSYRWDPQNPLNGRAAARPQHPPCRPEGMPYRPNLSSSPAVSRTPTSAGSMRSRAQHPLSHPQLNVVHAVRPAIACGEVPDCPGQPSGDY
jgi:hypothetical protein